MSREVTISGKRCGFRFSGRICRFRFSGRICRFRFSGRICRFRREGDAGFNFRKEMHISILGSKCRGFWKHVHLLLLWFALVPWLYLQQLVYVHFFPSSKLVCTSYALSLETCIWASSPLLKPVSIPSALSSVF